MDWNSIVTTGGVILAFFGAVSIVAAGVKAIKEWINPVTKLTDRCSDLERRADKSDEEYDKLKKVINAQSNLLIEMTNHMITGNDVDKLKEKRDELTSAMLE